MFNVDKKSGIATDYFVLIFVLMAFPCVVSFSTVSAESLSQHNARDRRDDVKCSLGVPPCGQQSSAEPDPFFGMIAGLAMSAWQQQMAVERDKQKEFALGPIHPRKAKYSRAKDLINGHTLLIDNVSSIYFDSNGVGSTMGNEGKPRVFRWYVSGDQFCLGKTTPKSACMTFVFNKKGSLTGLKKSSGGVFGSFQLLGKDINEFSQYTANLR